MWKGTETTLNLNNAEHTQNEEIEKQKKGVKSQSNQSL